MNDAAASGAEALAILAARAAAAEIDGTPDGPHDGHPGNRGPVLVAYRLARFALFAGLEAHLRLRILRIFAM